MTSLYHERGLSRNDTGLPEQFGLPLLDWGECSRPDHEEDDRAPNGLTPGGWIIYRKTHRPVATCNAIAALAGVGTESHHA